MAVYKALFRKELYILKMLQNTKSKFMKRKLNSDEGPGLNYIAKSFKTNFQSNISLLKKLVLLN